VILKVVPLFGGAGMRLADMRMSCPKPMVQIGTRPIIWHLIDSTTRIFGHKDFIPLPRLSRQWIKDYFLHYDESFFQRFVWSKGWARKRLLNRDIDDWTITLCRNGHHQRPRRYELLLALRFTLQWCREIFSPHQFGIDFGERATDILA